MTTSSTRKICVVGAGAIGGFLAARLAHAGNEVSVLARGRTLAAIRKHGIRLQSEGQQIVAPVSASDQATELGQQDIVILAVKAPSLASVAAQVTPLLGTDTVVLPALNGIPWWFFQGATGTLGGHRLRAVDPDGTLERAIPAKRIIGSVIFPSSSSPEPGVIVHASGTRMVFGEPSGPVSARVEAVVATLKAAGFAAEVTPDVRMEVWLKLLGNACFNPVSLITGSPTDDMIDDPGIHRLFAGMMLELLELGRRIGITVDIEPEARLAFTRKLGHIKTSMLQDAEAGRPVEIDGILGTVVEIAEHAGCPAPLLTAVYAIARMRAQAGGLYPMPPPATYKT